MWQLRKNQIDNMRQYGISSRSVGVREIMLCNAEKSSFRSASGNVPGGIRYQPMAAEA